APLTYAWSVTDPSGDPLDSDFPDSAQISFTPPKPGIYSLLVEVTDSADGLDDTATTLVNATEPSAGSTSIDFGGTDNGFQAAGNSVSGAVAASQNTFSSAVSGTLPGLGTARSAVQNLGPAPVVTNNGTNVLSAAQSS